MKRLTVLFSLFCISFSFAQSLETFHDFSAVTIAGDTISLSQYAGKKVLVVNTASFCAYTPQYNDLEQLYTQYGGPGFEILGFPCDDFGHQEPGDDSTINGFCTGNYNVTFQMMHKIAIISADTLELYKWLQLQSRNGVADAPVTWNFNKFCIDEAGHWVAHYEQTTNPLDTAIVNWILSPSVTGINSTIHELNVKLMENPSRDFIRLTISSAKNKTAKVQLYSMDGRFVQTLFDGTISSSASISCSSKSLDKGLYLVHILSGDQSQTIRVAVVE